VRGWYYPEVGATGGRQAQPRVYQGRIQHGNFSS
jgi:hypothetical protein